MIATEASVTMHINQGARGLKLRAKRRSVEGPETYLKVAKGNMGCLALDRIFVFLLAILCYSKN